MTHSNPSDPSDPPRYTDSQRLDFVAVCCAAVVYRGRQWVVTLNSHNAQDYRADAISGALDKAMAAQAWGEPLHPHT